MKASRLALKEKQGFLNSPEARKKVSSKNKGKIPWNKNRKGRLENHNTEGLKFGHGWNKGKKLGFIPKMAFKKGDKRITGSKNPAWKGGITPENHKIRSSTEYKLWRKAVFERDNYTCVWCKRKEEVSGKLNADHIKPFAYFPELRFAIDNGRTLCIDCHKTTDTYLKKIKLAI